MPLQDLPKRLQPVVPLRARGFNNAEIARELGVKPHTAEKYVSDLKSEVGARDRVALVRECEQMVRPTPSG